MKLVAVQRVSERGYVATIESPDGATREVTLVFVGEPDEGAACEINEELDKLERELPGVVWNLRRAVVGVLAGSVVLPAIVESKFEPKSRTR